MYSNLSKEELERIAQQARAKALAEQAQIAERNKTWIDKTATVQAQRDAGLINDNLLDALGHGVETGVSNIKHGFGSAVTGAKYTGAELLGMDEAASNLERQLRENAAKQAARQEEINQKYDANFGMLAKGLSDMTSGAIGMAPMIGAAILTPQGKAAVAGKVAQAGQRVLRSVPAMGVMGTQVAGLGTNQALNEGAETPEALKYGVGTAVKEMVTEAPFAGIAKVPALFNVGQKIAGSNKLASGVINAATEGVEESMSEFLDPYIQRATYNPNAENASVEDLLYAAIIGAGSAGMVNSSIAGVGKVANMALGGKKVLPTARNQGESSQNAQDGSRTQIIDSTIKDIRDQEKGSHILFSEDEKIRKQMEMEEKQLLEKKQALEQQKAQMEQAEREKLEMEIQNLEQSIKSMGETKSPAFDNALFTAMDEYTTPETRTLPTASQQVSKKRKGASERDKLVQELSALLNDPISNAKRINEIWAKLDKMEQAEGLRQQYGENVDIPMEERNFNNVTSRDVKAYQQTHPEVKAFFREQAEILLNDLNNQIDGGREYGFDPETRNVTTVRSQTRLASSPIESLMQAGMTKDQIRDGLERIIRDNGAENTVNAKRVETVLDDSLANGYQSMQGRIPKNLNYAYRNADTGQLQRAYDALNTEDAFANARNTVELISEMEYLEGRATEGRQLIEAYSELLPNMSVYENMTAEELHNEMSKLENASQYAPDEIAGEMMKRHRYLELLEEGRVNEFVENEGIREGKATLQKQLEDKKLQLKLPKASDEMRNIQRQLEEVEAKQAGVSIFSKVNYDENGNIDLETSIVDAPVERPEYVDYDLSKLSEEVVDFYEMVNRVGGKFGFRVRIVDGLDKDTANGIYDGEGTILLDGNKMIDESTISRVIGHEVYHFLKDTDEHKYIIDLALEGKDKVAEILRKFEAYAEHGAYYLNPDGTIDVDAYLDEIGAEYIEGILSDPAVAERIWNENPTLAERIINFFEDIIDYIRSAVKGTSSTKKALDAYSRGLRNMQYQKQSHGENRYYLNDIDRVQERFAKRVDDIAVNGNVSKEMVLVGKTPDALKYLGYQDAPVFISQKHIYTLFRSSGKYKGSNTHYHDLGDIVKQLPSAIQKPLIVAESKDGGSTVMLTELTDKNGKPVIAVVKFNGKARVDNRLQIEANILLSAYGKNDANTLFTDLLNDNKFLYVDKKRSPLLQSMSWLQLPRDVTTEDFTENVAQFREKVNSAVGKSGGQRFSLSKDSSGRRLSAEQADYFKDSKVRDDSGNLMVMYHGSPNAGFTEFRTGTYFTPMKWYADGYKKQGASMLSYKKAADNPDTYEVYLNIEKPFDTRNPKERRIFEQEYYQQWGSGAPLADSGLPDWTDGMDLQEFIEEKGYDYDGLILDEGAVGGYGEEVKRRGLSYVVFNPEQVKNVDNQTPTKSADIRYSLPSDKEYMDAVNRGDMETAQRMVNEAAEKAGYRERLYHQTGNLFTRFNTDNQSAGKYDHETPTGIFLKPDDRDIGLAGKRQMSLLANMQNPLHFTDRNSLSYFWKANIPKYADVIQQISENDVRYQALYDEADKRDTELYKKVWEDRRQGLITREQFEKILETGEYEAGSVLKEWQESNNALRLEAKGLIDAYMQDSGYDGVIIDHDAGSFGRSTKSYIVFSPEQVKQTDAVTYDDNGEIIPLSKRFDTGNRDIRYSLPSKEQQLSIIQNSNPMRDDYHTGIRSVDDILTFEEAIQENVFTPDYTEEDAQNALQKGKITVYSSYPISQGVFVTPSKMEAQLYAGGEGGKVYSKTVSLNDVAWIDSLEGQYAKVDNQGRYSFDDLVDEYGAMPKGENPYGTNRDIDVPQRTADDNRVSRFVRTAVESSNVDDVTVGMIERDMEQGRFVYEPTGNKKQIDRANRLIEHKGWSSQVNAFKNKYDSGERMTADDIVLGERLIQEAQSHGDYATAVDLIADVAALGTELGQAVQALSVLKRLTPQGKVQALKRVEARINSGLAEQNKGAVKIPNELLEQMLQTESVQMQADIWDKCMLAMAEQSPATLADKVNAWRYLAMLSNPKTHIRNFVGNSVMRGVSALKRGVQNSLENRLLTAEEERLTTLNRNVPAEYIEFAKWVWNDEGRVRAEASGGRYNDAISIIERNKKIFKNDKLESWRKGNEGALFGADMMFKEGTFVNALARYMYANNLKPSMLQDKASLASYEKGVEYALLEADKATFQEASKMAQLLSQVEHSSPAAQVAMGAVFPFKKTPINILKRGVEYSPVGLMNGLYKMSHDVQNGNITKAEAIDAISAGLTGTAIMALGCFMASLGMISAGEDEDDSRKQWYDQSMGSQNYALVLPNGATATIDWMAPAVMPLMAGAELYKQLTAQNTDNENSTAVTVMLESIMKVANPVLEMSMLQGLTDTLKSYNQGTAGVLSDLGTSMLSSYGGQFIPAPVGALTRTIDDTVRSSYAPKDSMLTKEGEKFLRQQANKLPIASAVFNEPSMDVWGNPREREGGNIIGRAFNNFINPATYSSNKKTELDYKLDELYEATGNSGVYPKSGATYINATETTPKVQLNHKEYARYGTVQGQKSRQYVESFVNSYEYNQIPNSEKVDIISDLYSIAEYQARKEVLNARGYNYADEKFEKVLRSQMNPQDYYVVKYNVDVIAENTTEGEKDAQIAYLRELKLSGVITDEQFWYLRRVATGKKFNTSEMASCPYDWIRKL